MEDAYLTNISFKDLILKYLIEEIIKEEKGDLSDWFAYLIKWCYHGWVLIPD